MSELISKLQQLADDCAHDDALMTDGPWTYDEETGAVIRAGHKHGVSGGSVGYENARRTIDDDDGASVATTRNRLPVLVRVLREAATTLKTASVDPDLSDAHIERVALQLLNAFETRGSLVNWRALARAAIQLGAVAA